MWRDIKTAPRDTAITIAGGDIHYPITANWSGLPDECWNIDAQGDIHGEIDGWPTHWMPLPPEPGDDTPDPAALLAKMAEALMPMVYEATHLSPMNDDGSHNCKISRAALTVAREALVEYEAAMKVPTP